MRKSGKWRKKLILMENEMHVRKKITDHLYNAEAESSGFTLTLYCPLQMSFETILFTAALKRMRKKRKKIEISTWKTKKKTKLWKENSLTIYYSSSLFLPIGLIGLEDFSPLLGRSGTRPRSIGPITANKKNCVKLLRHNLQKFQAVREGWL